MIDAPSCALHPGASDYLKFYDLEHYLFCEVGPRFVRSGKISPVDFYMILIWKANRAKTRIRDNLKKNKKAGSFGAAVEIISESLHATMDPKERLKMLMEAWGFRLPMATAILTVLYPEEFSVYDVRVCDQLKKFKDLAERKFSDELWNNYQDFLNTLKAATPADLSLRDKDRSLWARSFYEGIERDLA